MTIGERDRERLEAFINKVLTFLETKNTNTYYKEQRFDPSGRVELMDGRIVPAVTEGPVMLHNEFQSFVIGTLLRYTHLMRKNLDNQLFGFAERPLMEFITTWVFIAVSSNSVPHEDRERIITLLFAGHYKFIEDDQRQLSVYLEQKGGNLLKSDRHALNALTMMPFFNRIWSLLKDEMIKKRALSDNISFLRTQSGYQQIIGHQHMRTHANPLSINELVGTHDQASRHHLLMCFYLRQVIEYFRETDNNGYRKMRYAFDKFWDNHKISID